MKNNIFIFLLLFVFALSVSNVSGEQFDENRITTGNNPDENVNYVRDDKVVYDYNLNYECNNYFNQNTDSFPIKYISDVNRKYDESVIINHGIKDSYGNDKIYKSEIADVNLKIDDSKVNNHYVFKIDESCLADENLGIDNFEVCNHEYDNIELDYISGGVGEAICAEESDIDDCNGSLTNNGVKLDSESDDKLIVSNLTKHYGNSDKLNILLVDYKNNGIANADVSITVNNKTYVKSTDDTGKIQMNINLNSGNYTVNVKYNQIQSNASIEISPTLNADNITKIYKNSTQYYATFTDADGNFLAHKTGVNFNINGVLYTRFVEGNVGKAKLNLNLEQGNYLLTAINPITHENMVNNIVILPSIVENSDLVKYYKNNSRYELRILNDIGESQKSGAEVTFNINGVCYTRTTNDDGIVGLNINLNSGDYIITAQYNGCRVSNNIKVLPVLSAVDLVKKYSDNSSFDVKLVDGVGNPFKNQNIEYNINGIIYNRITDDNGISKLNINLQAGEYIITSSYNGESISNNITVEF